MNLLNILSEIEKVDPEVYGRLDSRRRVFQHLSGLGGKLAVAAVPFALGSIFNKAYAGATATQATVLEVLNYALLLEHLEANFYNIGTGSTTITSALSANNVKSLNSIKTDENNHVTFLRGVIAAAPFNATPVAPAATDFDYTGAQGGSRAALFADVLTNPATFLAVAQALEDTGVRAYKGSATDLMSNKTVLEAALNIHSVEARHAARVRTMRRGGLMPANDRASLVAPGANLSTSPKSWVSGRDGGGPAPGTTDAVYGPGTPASGTATTIFYPAEDNVTQAGASISTILTTAVIAGLATTNIPTAASEAFDEPLDMATVKAIARNFVKTGTPTFALLS
ncbi:ferritin-like domain-containing protein [Hymenobacter sp. BT683]|uniref:Ferritin-like domain-containing protein n=1 Tax=Hymenobacter jeongseonensis TaxID=2791027 RepID=A0ABS0IM84_9BACT|nr:ferritin-like domain-containing protein [Hymenobacter jeongseonensis]MBF9239134.1 ferritin-like domain-containing protein [Hymenobacter jeongseonensis]